jgi:uncharacterized protein YcbK (DUF882 family)
MFAGMSAAALLPRAPPAAESSAPKRIALFNLQTDERLEVEYFRDGAYLADALGSIAHLLRDFRTGEQHAIDPQLLDYLLEVAMSAGAQPEYRVISGFRSPETNGKSSLHMEGRAIDVRLPKVDCSHLAACALELARGGVGYYRASDFVHLDTGRYRTWRG